MIFYLSGRDADLQAEQLDALHDGTFEASYRTAFKSSDGVFEGGFWEFSGEMTNPPTDGRDMAVVLLEGSVEIDCGDEHFSMVAGDLIVFEDAVAAKTYRSDGFRAVYLRRFRGVPPTEEERAAARAGPAAKEG